ncbi:hypothetical protein D9M72_482310 [compost metagenome]
MVSNSVKPGSCRVRKRAFQPHSANSSAATLSWTMPPPTPISPARRPFAAAGASTSVRIATDSANRPAAASPAGASIQPIAPVYSPRGVPSSSAMICMVRRLGAPVIEPHGNSAAISAPKRVPDRAVAVTVEVICSTAPNGCTAKRSGTATLPGCAMRPRSLRSRSTIITFSARFLASAASAAAACASRTASPERGAVPFIGRVSRWSWPSWRTNSSGDSDSTVAPSGRVASTPYGTGCAARSAAYSATGSPKASKCRRWV